MTADDLLDVAADLVRRETGRPRQASLKRAASTAYYALFHALAHECVSQTVGWRFRSPDDRNAVTPIYRAVDHGAARTVFRRVVSDATSSSDLRTLAQAFVDMQAARIRTDPKPAFYREDAAPLVDLATRAVALFRALPNDAKRLLVVQLISKQR